MSVSTSRKAAVAAILSTSLLGAAGAAATVTLGADADQAAQFAAETLGGEGNTLSAGGATWFNVSAAGALLLHAPSSIHLGGNKDWYVRLDLTDMVIRNEDANPDTPGVEPLLTVHTPRVDDRGTPDPADDVTTYRRLPWLLDRDIAVAYGGRNGSTAIYRINTPVSNGIPMGSVFRFDLDRSLAVSGREGDYHVEVGLYESLSRAVNRQGDLSGGGSIFGGPPKALVRVVKSVRVGIDEGTPAIADAAGGFTRFLNAAGEQGEQAFLGTVAVTAEPEANGRPLLSAVNLEVPAGPDNPATAVQAGSPVHPATILGGGTSIAVAGDFSFGAFSLVPAPAAPAGCPEPDAGGRGNLLEPSAENAATGGIHGHAAPGNLAYTLCVNLGEDNETAVVPGRYAANVTIGYRNGVPAVARRNEHDPTTRGAIGEIRRNGATVHLSHLTDHPSYNQRIVIVNRGRAAVDYFIDPDGVFTEDGVRPALGQGAAGTVQAGSKLVVPVSDVLTFDAGNRHRRRAAATLSLVGDPAEIDVATTQVNRGDGSTDTLLYVSRGVRVN